jgi:hypothetical protein
VKDAQMNMKFILVAVVAVCGLAACGDNPQADAPAPPPTPQTIGDVPVTALTTTTAFAQFAASLVKTETGKPLDVNGVMPPTSETAAPIPVL